MKVHQNYYTIIRVIKMKLNKYRYKVIEGAKKEYFYMSSVELRQKLNIAFEKSIQEEELTGVIGKYQKHGDRYKIKYIYTRNAQLQPKTYERYFLLAEVGTDEKGTYAEYALVYDRLFEPLVRISYVLTVLLIIGCLLLLMKNERLDRFSAYALSLIAAATVPVVFKKSRETEETSRKTVDIFEKTLKNL